MDRMRELIDRLNEASLYYYQKGTEIMSNLEYDRLYDELLALEKETGILYPDSPTRNVGYQPVSGLPEEDHPSPMLSLDKTKSISSLRSFLGDQTGVLSWKLDGLTIVLTYRGGRLWKAVTRGNGLRGEVVTPNARFFENLPEQIPYTGELVLRAEAIITYSDFEKINAEIPEEGARYKNPRNLCSGSVRQLDPLVTKTRHVRSIVFQAVSAEDGLPLTMAERLQWVESLGFQVVEHVQTGEEDLEQKVREFEERIAQNDFPSDGLVLSFNDIAYGDSLGMTSKYPKNAIAFKWQDETAETVLREIEWSASRTGLINPVAVFDPVELLGTTVSRAGVHNVSIVEELRLGIGDRITVYKANMIIPQIAENLTGSGTVKIPEFCPVCGKPTEILKEHEAKVVCCPDPLCPAKKLKGFALMVSRDALNAEGLSEATIEKMIAKGFLKEYADLFSLKEHREEIAEMPGFGEKSADNLIACLEKARTAELYRFVYGLGIPGVGLSCAKLLSKAFGEDYEALKNASAEELTEIEKVGPVIAGNICRYFADPLLKEQADRLFGELDLQKTQAPEEKEKIFSGKTFVITGDVHHFRNRREAEALIESLGGKTASSVSKKTDYLINNDRGSSSTKNKKAAELGIPVITEEEFLELAGSTDAVQADIRTEPSGSGN